MPSQKRALARGPRPLRAVTPEEAASWSDDSDSTLSEPLPLELDEAWSYSFQPGENVWVKTTGGNWRQGRVTGQTTRKGATRQSKEGLYYPVVFDGKIRKYFAPLNGEIKPDTLHTHRLLKEAGWLND
ncbi:hypothetical protein E4T56_gene18073 [Termitomyces sp. T112]|nr:hypothetical protein C0989_007882 [Termitomyces sp. Mn162]KAG5724093.1 hypothetical protein E4T56_gene18073 [Termitomyces sp. T112]KAH0590060.1 hypothetical protein H2248_000235 [Termitomyces sp. 'cryptogamus']KNZ72735.1 hypothetical protein J132_01939 [Termitomyces sp. J132]